MKSEGTNQERSLNSVASRSEERRRANFQFVTEEDVSEGSLPRTLTEYERATLRASTASHSIMIDVRSAPERVVPPSRGVIASGEATRTAATDRRGASLYIYSAKPYEYVGTREDFELGTVERSLGCFL